MSNSEPAHKVTWTEADRARHRAIRETFRDWHPSPEELIASGEAVHFQLHGEFRGLRPFLESLKQAREAAGLTLAEVSRLCGIDQPALSRLENGHNRNPTLDTLWKYAAALGKRLVLDVEDVEMTRPSPPDNTRRRRTPRKQAGEKAARPSSRKHQGARK